MLHKPRTRWASPVVLAFVISVSFWKPSISLLYQPLVAATVPLAEHIPLPKNRLRTTYDSACAAKYEHQYLEAWTQPTVAYCKDNSDLVCYYTTMDSSRIDSFCVGHMFGLSSKSKLILNCEERSFTDMAESIPALDGLHKSWFGTEPRVVLDEYFEQRSLQTEEQTGKALYTPQARRIWQSVSLAHGDHVFVDDVRNNKSDGCQSYGPDLGDTGRLSGGAVLRALVALDRSICSACGRYCGNGITARGLHLLLSRGSNPLWQGD